MKQGEGYRLQRFRRSDSSRAKGLAICEAPESYVPEVHSHEDFQRVFGNLDERPLALITKGAALLDLRNVECRSGSDLLLQGSRATFIGLDIDNEHYLESYDLERLELITNLYLWLRDFDLPDHTQTLNQAVIIFGSYMNQWGHCFQDLLYRLLAVGQDFQNIPVLVQQECPTNFLDLIQALFGFNDVRLIPKGVTIRVKRALVPLPRTSCPVGWSNSEDIYRNGSGWTIDPRGTRQLQIRAERELNLRHNPSKKIYLRRTEGQFRPLLNEKELCRGLEAIGFESVAMEDLPLREALSFLADAEIVVGVSGSQFLNLLLVPPGVKCAVITAPFQSPYIVPQGLLAAGHKVSLIRARTIAAENLSPYGLAQGELWVSVVEVLETIGEFSKPRAWFSQRRTDVMSSGTSSPLSIEERGE